MISCDGWPDCYQQHDGLKQHCMKAITHWDAWHLITGRIGKWYDMTAITLWWALESRPRSMGVQAVKEDQNDIALLWQWEEHAHATTHRRQSETWRMILQYYKEIYLLNILIIASLLHTRNLSLYVWVQIDTTAICCPIESQVLRRSDVLFRIASFNPHLIGHLMIPNLPTYQLQHTLVDVYRAITLLRIPQRSFISRRAVIFAPRNDIKTW